MGEQRSSGTDLSIVGRVISMHGSVDHTAEQTVRISLRVVLAAASALVYVLGYPPTPLGAYAWVATALGFAGITAAAVSSLSSREAFFAGFIYTAVSTSLITTDVTFRLALAAVPAVAYPALLGGSFGVLIRLIHPAVRFLIAPLLWTAIEVMRAWITGGTYWWHPSVVLASSGWGRGLTGVVGRDGAALVVLAAGAGIAALAAGCDTRRRVLPQGAILIVLAAAGILVGTGTTDMPGGKQVRLAAVQTQYGIYEKWRPENLQRELDTLVSLTSSAAKKGARLVVWPETASPADPFARPEVMQAISRAASSTAVVAGALVGPPRLGPAARLNQGPVSIDQARNVLLFIERGKPAGMYAKVTAFPYGELGLQRGKEYSPIRISIGMAAPLICWENAIPRAALKYAHGQAQIAVVAATLGWFGERTDVQYLAHSRMLAAELRIPVVQSVNMGTSAIIDPLGSVLVTGPHRGTDVVIADTVIPEKPSGAPIVAAGIRLASMLVGLLSVLATGASISGKKGVEPARTSKGRSLLWSTTSIAVLAALYRTGYWVASFPVGHPAATTGFLMGTAGLAMGYGIFGPIWRWVQRRYGSGAAHAISLIVLTTAGWLFLPVEAAAWMMICAIPLSYVRARFADSFGPAAGVSLAGIFAFVWSW